MANKSEPEQIEQIKEEIKLNKLNKQILLHSLWQLLIQTPSIGIFLLLDGMRIRNPGTRQRLKGKGIQYSIVLQITMEIIYIIWKYELHSSWLAGDLY